MNRLSLVFVILFCLAEICLSQLLWSPIQTSTSNEPPGRYDFAFGYDGLSGRNRLVLFGGRNHGGALGDTWLFDLNTLTWQEVNTTPSPQPRFGTVYGVYTTGNQFLVATGEGNSKAFFNDVWALDLSSLTWSLLPNNGAENFDARYGSAGGIHPQGTLLFASHGFSSVRYSDGWVYDLVKQEWQQFFGGTNSYSATLPHARCLIGSAVHTPTAFAMYGGCMSGGKAGGPCPTQDSWLYDLSQGWKQASTCLSPSQLGRMSLWPLNPMFVLLHGGRETGTQIIKTRVTPPEELHFLNTYTGKFLVARATSPSVPGSRWGHGLV
eukprot:Colp12_sorted_trinity150504_noHs@8496